MPSSLPGAGDRQSSLEYNSILNSRSSQERSLGEVISRSFGTLI